MTAISAAERGRIDRERELARLAERRRLAAMVREWTERDRPLNGIAPEHYLALQRLLGTDY